jgi:hypothetical protein
MVKGGAEIGLEHPLELSGNGAAHQHQGVNRKKRVLVKLRDVVAAQEALGFQRLIFGLVLDAAKRIRRRHVASSLVDPAEQYRHILEFCAGAPLDRGNDELGQIGVRAAKIELKFNLQRTSHLYLPREHLPALRSSKPARTFLLIQF